MNPPRRSKSSQEDQLATQKRRKQAPRRALFWPFPIRQTRPSQYVADSGYRREDRQAEDKPTRHHGYGATVYRSTSIALGLLGPYKSAPLYKRRSWVEPRRVSHIETSSKGKPAASLTASCPRSPAREAGYDS